MKKILSYIILIAGVLALSCDREEFDDLAPAEYKYIGMVSQRIPGGGTVFEGTGISSSSIDIPLLYDLGDISSDIEITFTVSGAVLGTDFTVPNAASTGDQTFSISIPVDTVASFFTIEPITNDVQNENKVISLSITGTPEGVFAGAPLSQSTDITIIDDDCPYDFEKFVGTASVIENGTTGPYDVNTTAIAPNTIRTDNFWDSDIAATFILVPCDGTVQVPQQSTPAFGDPDGNIVGSGTWDDETGEVVVNVTINFPAFDFISNEQHVYTFP